MAMPLVSMTSDADMLSSEARPSLATMTTGMSSNALRPNGDVHDAVNEFRSVQRLHLEWTHISHVVKVKSGRMFKRTTTPKTILSDLTGHARPGQLLSIMGPSGGGKTSLLNVLGARIKPVEGTVLLNGAPIPHGYRRLVAYVMQDDILPGTLTPRELFMFAANLRLPSYASEVVPPHSLTHKERQAQVAALLDILSLNDCANTRVPPATVLAVGQAFERGLSGGERKRTSIGYELITNPSLIFLDEPTTGLDSFTALTVIETLRKLANLGRTVICTIHQPSSEIFSNFDSLILLAGGRMVYSGPAAEAVDHFQSNGFECPPYSNPSDYFMRVLSNRDEAAAADLDRLVESQKAKTKLAIEAAHADLAGQVREVVAKPEKRPGRWKELYYLTKRSWDMSIRNPIVVRARVAQFIVIALIFGAIYIASIQSRNGLLFLIASTMVFASTSAIVLVFPLEKLQLIRDQSTGMYRTWTYSLAKFFSDLPISTALPLLFAAIIYWFAGLANSAAQFFYFYLICFLTVGVGNGIGMLLGSAFSNAELAVSVMPLIIVPLMLFGGLFINLDSIPVWVSWIQWISVYKYSYEALIVNEYTGMTLYCDPDELIVVSQNISVCPVTTGQQEITNLSLSSNQLWIPLVVLAGMMVALRVLSVLFLVLQMRRLKKLNQ